MSQKFPIRPLRIAESIDVGLEGLRQQLSRLLVLLAVLYIPWAAGANLYLLHHVESNPGEDLEHVLSILSLALAIQLVLMVTIVPLAAGGMTRLLYAAILGKSPPSLWQAVIRTLPRYPALAVASLFLWIGSTMGKMLFIVPGLLIEALFLSMVPVLILEPQNPIKGLLRAADLSMKDYWKAVVLVVVIWAVEFMLGLCRTLFPDPHVQVITTAIVQGCSMMIGLALSLSFYLSTRAKHEHLDLDLMVDQLHRDLAATESDADSSSRPTWHPQPK